MSDGSQDRCKDGGWAHPTCRSRQVQQAPPAPKHFFLTFSDIQNTNRAPLARDFCFFSVFFSHSREFRCKHIPTIWPLPTHWKNLYGASRRIPIRSISWRLEHQGISDSQSPRTLNPPPLPWRIPGSGELSQKPTKIKISAAGAIFFVQSACL